MSWLSWQISKPSWAFDEDGTCTITQTDPLESRADVVVLSAEEVAQFVADAKKHTERLTPRNGGL